MSTQLTLSFDTVPITCEVQQRYHSIAPCLAGVRTPAEQAQALNLGYSTITRWLRKFREEGLPGLLARDVKVDQDYRLFTQRPAFSLGFGPIVGLTVLVRALAGISHHCPRSVDCLS